MVRGGRVTFSGHGDGAETRVLIKSFGYMHVMWFACKHIQIHKQQWWKVTKYIYLSAL